MKLDLKKELKHLYNASAKAIEIVKVPPMRYLMIDGKGDPNTAQAYKDSVSALYSVAYTLRFALKKAAVLDYGVMPLEGLWWTDDPATMRMDDKSDWQWTMLIVQPDAVTNAAFEQALEAAGKKKDTPLLDNVRFEPYDEGVSAQIMHHGSYADEPPTIERLHTGIASQGYRINGKHHEIYLNDPTRTAPDRLKTIIRYPIVPQ